MPLPGIFIVDRTEMAFLVRSNDKTGVNRTDSGLSVRLGNNGYAPSYKNLIAQQVWISWFFVNFEKEVFGLKQV